MNMEFRSDIQGKDKILESSMYMLLKIMRLIEIFQGISVD